MGITNIEKLSTGQIEFSDGTNIVASLNENGHAERVGMQGIKITDATGSKITVFAGVIEKMISPTGGTVTSPTQQQVLGELATNFFRS